MHIRQILVVGLVVTLGIAPLSAQKGGGGGGSTATVVSGPPELRVSNEIAAPGGIAQIKVTLTEPKPIMTGLFDFSGVGDVAGIAAFSPQNDTTGIAWPTASGLRIAAVSTMSDFGTDPLGYPLLTLTVRVPASASIGSVIPIHLDPSALALFDPNGVQYAATVTDGSITVGQVPAIEDVIPGSDIVPAHGTITLLGRNFNSDVRVQVDGADIDRVLLVSPSRMDVIIKSPLAMFARQIRLRTKTGNSFYYAYQRTTPAVLSSHDSLKGLEPMFGVATSNSATVAFPVRAPEDLQVLFVENSHLAPMTGTVSRTSAAGTEEATFSLPGAGRFALDLDEIFGSTADDGCVITITASSPVLSMGAITDEWLSQVRLIAGS